MKVYEIAIPVRCDDCDEVETKVRTELPAENLPDCPNCGAAHFGGGGETGITPDDGESTPDSSGKQKDNNAGQQTADTDGESFEQGYRTGRNEVRRVARQLAEAGMSPSKVLDYVLVGELDESAESWADSRDVGKTTVDYNVNQAQEETDDGHDS